MRIPTTIQGPSNIKIAIIHQKRKT
uniref:Uncharacterized protein n=1 Tax=Rhizophora mucronata TaxID=61149 RepID=A0A2P2IJU2_RHIMU